MSTYLVPIENSKLDGPGILVASDVEQQLLVPYGIELVSNDSGSEDLLSE